MLRFSPRKAIYRLAITFTIVFLVLTLVTATGVDISITPFRVYRVVSSSMSPEFERDSLILVRQVDPAAIEVGDIITFQEPHRTLTTTHRVVDVNLGRDYKFTTRGDANTISDPNPVTQDMLVGKVLVSVPYLGRFVDYAQTRVGLLLFVFAIGMLVTVMEIRRFRTTCPESREVLGKV